MTSVIQKRWRTRQLVGDKQHAQIVRVRPGYMDRGYFDERRIDDGSTPFNGSPIFPPLIWQGHNHHCWQGLWTPTGPWVTLPNIVSSKWSRDFDIQTGGARGTSSMTTLMDNIAFPEEAGIGGLYHAIDRGHFSPDRGVTINGRPNVWPSDLPNTWQQVLDSGYQIELWEGYGQGTDIQLRTTLDPTTNSYAPASGALDRTWTGIVVDCENESHPDKITITAQDFGIYLTDQRLIGDNKAPECRAPITFADRRRTQGEIKVAGPYRTLSGPVTEDGKWQSTGTDSHQWIEVVMPQGYYEDFFVAPMIEGMEMWVSLYIGAGGGVMDRTTSLPAGWVTLGGPGTGTLPDGTPFIRHVPKLAESPARRWALGHSFDVPNGSKLRLNFSPRGATHHFATYRFGTDPSKAPGALATPGGVKGGAKGWILVEDAAAVVRMLFIWAGFKEWFVEDFGWSLWQPMIFGQDKFMVDVVNDMLQQGSFIFYMGPPSNDDRSIGKPHFEHIHALDPPRPVLEVRDTDMSEALEVKTDLSNLPWQLRYRGKIDKKHGQPGFGTDTIKRIQAAYFPPWTGRSRYTPVPQDTFKADIQIRRIAGIRRHFTETMSLTLVTALTTVEECLYACVLAAIQYALNMKTGKLQIPGLSRLKLNDTISVIDEATATNSRMWVSSVESEHVMGGEDTPGHWRMTLSGSIVDTVDMSALVDDYNESWKMNQRNKAGW